MAFEFDPTGLLDIGIKAKLRTFNGTGLDADKLAVVYYEVPLGAGGGCVDWLKANRKTVKDVQIDFQMLSGVWRSAGIVSEQSPKNKESVTIVQTFKYGWIQSLVSEDAVDWSEARYVSGNESATPTVLGEYPVTDVELNPQQYHLVRWEGIDPLKLDEVRNELRDLTPSAWEPTINGEALGTGFYLMDATAETSGEQDQDRSGTITALIAKPRFSLQAWENYGTPAESKVYSLFDVPLYLSQAIINLYNKRTGATASAGQPNERFLLTITITDKADESSTDKHISFRSCAMWSMTTYYHNIAAPLAAPANAMGITYSARFDFIRQSGSYSGTIEKRVRQTLHVGLHPAVSDYDRHVQREVWSGVYKDGANYQKAVLSIVEGDIVIALTTITELAATVGTDPILPLFSTDVPAQGEAREWSLSPNDDCTFDVTRTIDTEREVATAGRTTTVDAFSETLEKVARGMSAGGDDIVELDGTKIKLLRWEQDKYGKFTKQERELTPVPADTGWVEYPDRHGASYYRWFRNQTMDWIMTGTPAGGGGDPPAVPGIVQGMDDTTSNSLSVSTNAHTLYDGVATRQAFGGSGGYGTFTRSTRDDARTEIRYRDIEYTDNLFKTKIMVPHKAKFTILKRSAVTASYTDADNALTAYWQLSAGDYADAEMVSEPKASMVSDPDGRRGIRVEVVFQKQITDWIRAGDPF